jgi:shikimate dehydrogenase
MTGDPEKVWAFGLIGFPVGHSLSPVMHTAALRAAGLTGDYRLLPIPPLPDGKSALTELLSGVRSGQFDGLNVTIPHKQNVLALMDSLTPAARIIGAVNTISMRNGQLTGDNTDWIGFSRDLSAHLPVDSTSPDRKALVLGAGGSARAVVYALLQSGWHVNISTRRPEQSRQLAEEFSTPGNLVDAVTLMDYSDLPALSLIVNTTPVGMIPNIDQSPWPAGIPFPERAFLYDLIYNPAETALMKAARKAGLPASNGLGMLIEQAALAFEIWTGRAIPGDVFRQAILERTTS